MSEIRTRDEALAAIDRALAQWATTGTGVLTQAAAAVSAAQSAAEAAAQHWAARVAALDQQLSSLGPDDDPRPIERALAAVRESLAAVRQAARQIADVAQRLAALQRAHVRTAETAVEAARADLARRTADLSSYRGGGGGGAPASAASGGGGSSPARPGGTGLTDIDVASADFSGNPIIGSFGRGGASRADYRWAVQTWDEVVGPGVARGMTRADFEARDRQRGAPPLRRTADVYDLFLADTDRIRLSRLPDGTLDVVNGRHRLEVARELGVQTLPGEVASP